MNLTENIATFVVGHRLHIPTQHNIKT